MAETASSNSWLKPSLDWLLIFVLIAIGLRFIPAFNNPTALFIVSCLAIIPLAGWMAMRNKMDLSLGITLSSSLQIALFVAPVLLFASYIFGRPMNLEFSIPEVVAVFASILIVQQICSDGESNWIEGLQLLSVYAILEILFYFLPDAHHATTGAINAVSPAPSY